MKIKLKSWENAKNLTSNKKNIAISGSDRNWKEYIKSVPIEYIEHYNALRESIIEQDMRMSGNSHQYGFEGIPLFNDGTIALFSFREWGCLLSAIWSTEHKKQYDYMNFY